MELFRESVTKCWISHLGTLGLSAVESVGELTCTTDIKDKLAAVHNRAIVAQV